MKGFFKKFRDGFSRTTRNLFGFLGGRSLDAGSIDLLEEALYSADFGVETTEEIIREIQAAFQKERELQDSEVAGIAGTVMRKILAGSEKELAKAETSPTVVILLGVNGSGKTTTAAKLAYRLKAEGNSVLVAACDTFRAAANEQIKAWCDRLEIDLVSSQRGADAAAVAFDGWQAAKSRGKDFLVIDTAGRLHNKSHLMKELAKIRRVLQKQDASVPHHSILVVDGSLGSNSIEQARVFHGEFGLSGLIVTKLDGTSRGGALVGIYRELGLPIYFLGLGEKEDDLQPFSVEHYVDAIFNLVPVEEPRSK
ncbi:MAG: signal recognition particle-docking protein FtsY [Opitutales bacterium]